MIKHVYSFIGRQYFGLYLMKDSFTGYVVMKESYSVMIETSFLKHFDNFLPSFSRGYF